MSMPATMKSGVYYRNDNVRVEQRPIPVIRPEEVLVRVATCGICGSDTMHWYREPQARVNGGGINTGHEISGEIVQVGENVQTYKPHDRVVVAHHFPCGNCLLCRDGNETACRAMHEKHIEPGGFAEYIRILEKCVQNGLFLMPDGMTYAQGSYVEPLGCVVRSVRKTAPVACHTTLVIGSGLAGLLHIKLLRALGAGKIIAVDTNVNRLEVASRCGADEGVLATGNVPHADRVYVCTASERASEAALGYVNPGGQIMFFATGGPDMKVSLSLTKFWLTQTSINFSYGAAPRDMREAMELIRSGTVSVDDLTTHRFGIDQIGEAFDLVANPRESLKVMIEPNRDSMQ